MIRDKALWAARELVPVFLVAVAVAIASTLVGSVLDHVHQVDAESLAPTVSSAAAGSDGTQTLRIDQWGVQVVLPLAPELPTVSYAAHTPVGSPSPQIGLSSTDLQSIGVDCLAYHDALGALTRYPRGGFTPGKHLFNERFIATIGAYDYAYAMPQNACSNSERGSIIVNREVSIIQAALDQLSPLQP